VTEPALPAKRTRRVAPSATAATETTSAATTPATTPRVKAAAKPTVATPRAKAVAKPATTPRAKAAAKPATTPRAKATAKVAAKPAAAPSADGLPTRGSATIRAAKNARAAKAERPPLELARRIVELADDKKAADIILLDLTPLTTLADYFVICSGGSERQLDAIADGIVSALRDEKTKPYGREGTPASHWVLLDFGSVVVHIFTPPERDYYGLEKHWAEAKTILAVQ
jgi:ribosome-associated protein